MLDLNENRSNGSDKIIYEKDVSKLWQSQYNREMFPFDMNSDVTHFVSRYSAKTFAIHTDANTNERYFTLRH